MAEVKNGCPSLAPTKRARVSAHSIRILHAGWAVLLGRMFRVTPGHISHTNEPMRVDMGEVGDRTVPEQCEGGTGNRWRGRRAGRSTARRVDFGTMGKSRIWEGSFVGNNVVHP